MVKILELFSGYGTASFALKRIGMDYELVGYSDINKYANQCFKQNHCPDDVDDKLRLGDVIKINPYDLEDFDLLTGGFPCQAFSNAGKMKGELDPRGTLFNEIIRIAEVKQPKYMLLENVKGFTFKKFKDTFDKVLSELDRIGYVVYWNVLNSKDFGVPHNRERVWFVCFRKDVEHIFEFPKEKELTIFLKDILEDDVDDKYYLSEKAINGIMKSNYQERKPQAKDVCSALKVGGDVKCICLNSKDENNKQPKIQNRVYSSEGVSPAVVTGFMPSINTVTIFNPYNGKVSETESGTIGKTAQLLNRNNTIRRLTPKECFRLMGFLNDEINLNGLSDTQKYKLAGNGQDVNVVTLLFKQMLSAQERGNL